MLNIKEKHLDLITRAVYQILNGKQIDEIKLPADYPDNELKQLTQYMNRLISEYADFALALKTVSQGDLDSELKPIDLKAMHSLKNLQANMRHMTWKTQQIAAGDYTHQVDFMGDFSVAFNTMTQQLNEAFEKIEQQNTQLAEAFKEITLEQEKSEKLLRNILPTKVAQELKETGATEPQSFDDVSVLFSDIIGFTSKAAKIDPALLIAELSELFTAFDEAMERNGCERIKTIGDAYLAVSGMPVPNPRHAENLVAAALEMIEYLNKRQATGKLYWPMRIGIHTGTVVGGVVGVKKYIYDVFGDTINTASRMESCADPMRINVSETTYLLVKKKFCFTEREAIEVKGKGLMKMYHLAS